MEFYGYKEAEPSYEDLLKGVEEEIKETWLLVQNETESDFFDADVSKIESLLEELKVLDERRTNLLERIDAMEEWRHSHGSI